MRTSDSVYSIYPALIKCWKAFPNMAPLAEGYGYKYIELNKVIDKAKEIMPGFGLAAIQFPESTDAENIGVTTRIIHESGEWIEGTVYATPTNMKGVNQTQATGATITYLRRYGLLCILGAAGDKDTDGRSSADKASNTAIITEWESALRECNTMASLSETWSTIYTETAGTDRDILAGIKDEMKAKLS